MDGARRQRRPDHLVLYACDVQSFVCFVQPSGINPTRATVAGLPSGRNYTVSVEALNGIGSSGNATAAEESTTKAVPMDAYPPFLAPTLDGLDPTSNLHVMWHAPFANGEPIEKYYLEVDGVEHEVDCHRRCAPRHSDAIRTAIRPRLPHPSLSLPQYSG